MEPEDDPKKNPVLEILKAPVNFSAALRVFRSDRKQPVQVESGSSEEHRHRGGARHESGAVKRLEQSLQGCVRDCYTF